MYTEMITADALLHGECARLLRFDPVEHPVALQLGGSDPDRLARAARRGAEAGYDEINLNVGCPSDRVQSGRFGACLMATPDTVARCVAAMCDTVDVPVTVKTRVGIDDRGGFDFLADFVGRVSEAGARTLVIHARRAILRGLSPKQNREIPPLDYPLVYRIKKAFPALGIVLNGGISSCKQVDKHLEHVDGVMIGRQAYQRPFFLYELQQHLFPTPSGLTRERVVAGMLPYVERALAEGVRLQTITRHMLGLYAGQPGARRWRRFLSETAPGHHADAGVLRESLKQLG